MAQPDSRAGYQIKLELGGDAPSDPYTFVCGIETQELNQESSVIERPVRDCDTPFAQPTMTRKLGLDMSAISGSGLLAVEYINDLQAAKVARNGKYWRFSVEDGPVWTGRYVMPTMTVTGNADGQAFAELTIALQSNGSLIYTPVA